MWKAYTADYLKYNHRSGTAIRIAAGIASLFLSILCGVFYNLWNYEVDRIVHEEGGWHSRLVGSPSRDEIDFLENHDHVSNVVISTDTTIKNAESQDIVMELYFKNIHHVLPDTSLFAGLIGILPENTAYHDNLLSMYLIRSPLDTAPRWIFPAMLLITVMSSISLIIIIHNAFAVSMSSRLHQFGILSGVGASPKQLRRCLVQEAAALCALPLLAGNLVGIASCMGLIWLLNRLATGIVGRQQAVYAFSPIIFILTLLLCMLTILISAWLPARTLSKRTPLETIKFTGEWQLKRKKQSPLLRLIFGIEGELAGVNLKAQKKALRMGSLSLLISFLAFTMMQCVITLMQVSIEETYTKRYQDIWDIMVTVNDTPIDTFHHIEEIQEMVGVRNAVMYQRVTAKRMITTDEMSDDLLKNGGFSYAPSSDVQSSAQGWLVNAPIVILDDDSFLIYCKEIGIVPSLQGGIILNQIRDVTDPNFRHPKFLPYVKENPVAKLQAIKGASPHAGIPILSYTTITPPLREEYAKLDYYELVHFIPITLWSEMKGSIDGAESELQICILGDDSTSLERLEQTQQEITRLLSNNHVVHIENRIQEQQTDAKMTQGMMAIFSGFCVLLAIIGFGNIFSNTLGYVQQRRTEVARYLSVGMTPKSLRKMFCIEGLVIAGKPILSTVPVTVFTVWFLLRSSYMNPATFLLRIPYFAILLFILTLGGMVALAYYLGWRQVRELHLANVLTDVTN
ncbi:MAG: ABC transporter permease [Clostridium sp.]|nr:ABC transporter permease [Clostridium sp.]